MAIAFRAQATGSGNPVVITNPGVVNGDMMVAVVGVPSNDNLSGSAGDTTSSNGWSQYGSGWVNNEYATFWTKVANNEGASWTWNTFSSLTGTTAIGTGSMAAYRGSTGSLSPGSSSAGTGTSQTITAPSISTGYPNEMVVFMFAARQYTATNLTPPSGFTGRGYVDNPAVISECYLADNIFSSAGATGSQSATLTNGNPSIPPYVAMMLGIVSNPVDTIGTLQVSD